VLYLNWISALPPIAGLFLTPISAVFCLVVGVLQFVVPEIICSVQRKVLAATPSGTDAVPLLILYRRRLITGAALCESGAFFAGMAFMLEGKAVILIAVASLLVLILARWPTEDRVRSWMVAQFEKIAEMRNNTGA
jgi:hypothetical protein